MSTEKPHSLVGAVVHLRVAEQSQDSRVLGDNLSACVAPSGPWAWFLAPGPYRKQSPFLSILEMRQAADDLRGSRRQFQRRVRQQGTPLLALVRICLIA